VVNADAIRDPNSGCNVNGGSLTAFQCLTAIFFAASELSCLKLEVGWEDQFFKGLETGFFNARDA